MRLGVRVAPGVWASFYPHRRRSPHLHRRHQPCCRLHHRPVGHAVLTLVRVSLLLALIFLALFVVGLVWFVRGTRRVWSEFRVQ